MSNKIDYNKPLNFVSIDPIQTDKGIALLTSKVSIMWEDIVAVEEFARRYMVGNDNRPFTIIRTRFMPTGYIAVATFEDVQEKWETYLHGANLGFNNMFRVN
jgi:hypothetical protein